MRIKIQCVNANEKDQYIVFLHKMFSYSEEFIDRFEIDDYGWDARILYFLWWNRNFGREIPIKYDYRRKDWVGVYAKAFEEM